MKTWSVVFNIFAVLILIMLLVVYYNNAVVIEKEFQEIRLKAAVSYSAEAAFLSTIEVEDIGIEYINLDAVVINPGDCLDVFESMMCLNYNMSPSEENKALIEEHIPVAVLACNDGYYITTLAEIDTTPDNGVMGNEYGLRWSIKKPYTINRDDTLYAVNLRNESWVSVRENNGNIEVKDGITRPFGATSQEYRNIILREINSQITRDMLYQIDKTNINRKGWDYTFYLPPMQTSTGINPIQKTSLLILLQGVNFASTHRIDVVNIAGLTTVRKKVVIAFIDPETNIKYYCYEGQLPETLMNYVENYYNNVEEAAMAGYKPHYEYLQKRIKYD